MIAVLSCHEYRHRADAQRATWLPLVHGADVRFFLGYKGGRQERPDEEMLTVNDDYELLSYKKRALCQWALDRDYSHVLKIDDDVYLQPERLLASDFQHDYVGTRSLGKSVVPYFSGFAHWLSRRSMEILAKAEIDDWAEDRWTGKVLHNAGIMPHVDDRYVIINSLNGHQNPITGKHGPRATNDILAAAEFEPEMMLQIHAEAMSQ